MYFQYNGYICFVISNTQYNKKKTNPVRWFPTRDVRCGGDVIKTLVEFVERETRWSCGIESGAFSCHDLAVSPVDLPDVIVPGAFSL